MKRIIIAEDTTVTDITSNDIHYSQMSFDFGYEVDYDQSAVSQIARDVLSRYNILGMDFEVVDYSSYPDYENISTSQCDVDFEYTGTYNRDYLESKLGDALSKIGYELIAVDFYPMDDAYKK